MFRSTSHLGSTSIGDLDLTHVCVCVPGGGGRLIDEETEKLKHGKMDILWKWGDEEMKRSIRG
jgi:hypothetical protein